MKLSTAYLIVGTIVVALVSRAHADTLTPVAPPTDWTGVFVVAAIAVIAVAVVGYVHYVRTTAGKQFGEDEIERIAEALHRKTQTIVINPPAATPNPLVYNGITFADQAKLDEYRAALAIVDSHKGGST